MSLSIAKEGIYVLYDKGDVVYIGQSDNLYMRIGQHIKEGKKQFDSFDVYETPNRKALETFLIEAFHPKYNIAHGGGGGPYGIRENTDKFFTSPDIEDAIKVFDGQITDISFRQVADDLNEYDRTIYAVVQRHKNEIPAWNIGNCWQMDYKWYKENKETLREWINEMFEQQSERQMKGYQGLI